MQDRPTAEELLQVLGEFLEREVMPALTGPLQFRARVAANIARILQREAQQGGRLLRQERDLLAGLLGDRAPPLRDDSLPEYVAALNQQLVHELDSAPGAAREVAIWHALMQVAKGKLAIARPGYDSYDAHNEVL